MLQAQGLYQQKPDLPYVPGMDLTGRVVEVGAGVDHVGVGDRVIAQVTIGALAETVCVHAQSVWKAPNNVWSSAGNITGTLSRSFVTPVQSTDPAFLPGRIASSCRLMV